MTLFVSILVFIFGTAIGSFLSVVIHRIRHKQKGILLSHSVCPSCKKKLKWRHLIPVLSWLFLRGKCGFCGKKISTHYFSLELITGLLFLLTFLVWNFVLEIPSTVNPELLNYAINWHLFETFIFYIILFTFLIGIFFYDLLYQEIPDRFSLPAIAVTIVAVLLLGLTPPLSMLIGGAGIFLFFLAQLVMSKGKWIGGGDLRLGALMGLLLGWKLGLIALIISYFLGSLASVILLIQKKANRKSAIPFGPFLVTGTVIAIFYGNQILSWYLGTL